MLDASELGEILDKEPLRAKQDAGAADATATSLQAAATVVTIFDGLDGDPEHEQAVNELAKALAAAHRSLAACVFSVDIHDLRRPPELPCFAHAACATHRPTHPPPRPALAPHPCRLLQEARPEDISNTNLKKKKAIVSVVDKLLPGGGSSNSSCLSCEWRAAKQHV
jgi:hypothetical protein